MRNRWIIPFSAACLFIAVVAIAKSPAERKLARARKVLEQVLLVDGAGSGLDADTLQGAPPSAFASADHTHPVLEERTQCMRVVGDVVVFDGCD
jgi:hypothetical protein